ncbi:hypothetical protein N7478_008867 [Penicillium angulare]|uniref:uncharacterized protein n=1 Tax=Penicillium angulare TaxID=116970 RepID=UPI002541FBE9|nr:uncharacterized protein N7478_008867 [Penicillium angulare]KAJ5273742.1 hypothetical protein N7478_008867 [Penicillium angulare]
MADVRSLLRNELASRKGTSPNTAGNRVTKKRKVDNSDGMMRKKLRSTSLESVQEASGPPQDSSPSAEGSARGEGLHPVEENHVAKPLPVDNDTEATSSAVPYPSVSVQSGPTQSQNSSGTVDEDEWAAFEREVAVPSRNPQAPTALSSGATISAAPVTAGEIAAQQEQDTVTTARAREAELDGEREDAARLMEEEFDEMDQLEERVRRLKHMREELRQKRARDEAQDRPTAVEDQRAMESDSDDDEDEDWDDWRFK